MCIIIIKQKGVNFPSVSNVKTSCKANPDGFGMLWWDAEVGKMQNFRTLNRAEFLKKYEDVRKLDFKTTSLIIHARIKTHGTVRLENTHCWLDEDIRIGFAHNGILSVRNREDMTDSETFFRDIFVPVYKQGGWSAAELAINAVIGTSKFAFMDDDGNIYAQGQFVKDRGCMYSNTSYKERYSYSKYGLDDYYRPSDSFYDWKSGRMVYRFNETDTEWKEKVRQNQENRQFSYRW